MGLRFGGAGGFACQPIRLVHIELQSTNDPTIPRLMRNARKRPAEYRSPKMRHSFRMAGVRQLDGASLLRSPRVGDNIIAGKRLGS